MHQQNRRLKQNNFDLLRLLFAGTVCLVHAHQLSGYQSLAWISGILSSDVAVRGFFVISGFLIFMSFERASSLLSYAGKRIRRIYPAYIAIVMLCAAGLFFVSSKTAAGYFSPAWIKYVLANLSFLNFLQPGLPGVFESNRLSAVNGALWTLKIEVMFYMSVPLIVFLFRKSGRLPVIIFIYAASVAWAFFMAILSERTGSGIYAELGRQLPGQLSYFISGTFLYYYLPFFERRAGMFLMAALLVLVIDMKFPLPALEPFALAVVVIFFGLFLYVGNAGRFGDFSYGTYILHFPLIQILLHTGWFEDTPWFFLGVVICLTLTGAIVMWHLVEKKFLFRTSHYIAAMPSPEKSHPPDFLLSTPIK